MFTGYILYLVVGVVAVAVTAIFYFYFEGVRGKVYPGLTDYLAWGHYVLMNIGVAGLDAPDGLGGYMAGYSGAAVSDGGLGYTNYQIHVHYLSHVENPIGALVLIAALGAIFGGLRIRHSEAGRSKPCFCPRFMGLIVRLPWHPDRVSQWVLW